MGPGGALEALMEAREQKLVLHRRHRHDLTVLRCTCAAGTFPGRLVLLPYNYCYPKMRITWLLNELQALCQQRNVAMQTSIHRGGRGR